VSGVWKGINYWANRRPNPPPPVAPPPERPAVGEAAFLQALPVATIQGWNVWAVYTHAWHETGGFPLTNVLVQANNFFGVKSPKAWTGQTVSKHTKEYLVSHPEYAYTADFCAWENANVAMAWYCDFIKRLYPNAYEYRGAIMNYFWGLMNGVLQYDGHGYVDRLEAAYRTLSSRPEVAMKLKPYLS